MTLLDDLPTGIAVGLDPSPFIYFVEAHARHGPVVRPLFEDRLEHGLNWGLTSVITLAEVLTKPLATGRADLVTRYRDLLTTTPGLQRADISVAVAERAADLRQRYGLKLPDALQPASSLEQGVTTFITNDIRLRKVTELRVLVLEDYVSPPPP